jgi:hypothetical protein
MASASADPLVIHATARLAVARFTKRRDWPMEGPRIGSAGELRKQHGAETSRQQAALVEVSRNYRGPRADGIYVRINVRQKDDTALVCPA